ncbi:hypothetical protein ACEQPO_11140 [Bacillus sp. SL00103]
MVFIGEKKTNDGHIKRANIKRRTRERIKNMKKIERHFAIEREPALLAVNNGKKRMDQNLPAYYQFAYFGTGSHFVGYVL